MPEPNFLGCVGEIANHCEAIPLDNDPPGVSASSEHAFFKAENQIDYHALMALEAWRVDEPAASNDYIRFNKNQLFNGSFETEDFTGWLTTGAATVVANPGGGDGGWVARFDAVTVPDDAVVEVFSRVRAEEKITVRALVRALAGGDTARVSLWIAELDQYWNGTAWVAAPADWVQETALTFQLHSDDIVIPDYDQRVPGGVYTLWITAYDEGYIDDVRLWHWTSLAAIIGHNATPSVTAVKLYASTNDFSTEVLVTEFDPVHWPNTYELFDLRGEQYWEFRFEGYNDEGQWVGQCWLAQPFTFRRSPNFGLEEEFHREIKENFTEGGAREVHSLEDIRKVDLVFTWLHPNEEDFNQIRDRLFEASSWSEYPALLIRRDDNPASAHMVYIPSHYRTAFLETDVEARSASVMTLPGLAYPTFTL